MRNTILFCVLLALIGCGETPTGVEFVGRAAMAPPQSFADTYAAVESCLGVSGEYDAVRWFVAETVAIDGDSGFYGYWLAPHEITMHVEWVDVDYAVRHEMVHDILQLGDAIHDEFGRAPCEGPGLGYTGPWLHQSVPMNSP